MAKESGMKRKEAEKAEGFGAEKPLLTGFNPVRKITNTINIMLTDRGLYENAKKRLAEAYNGASSKIRRMFKRK
jgi:hypothetical protein